MVVRIFLRIVLWEIPLGRYIHPFWNLSVKCLLLFVVSIKLLLFGQSNPCKLPIVDWSERNCDMCALHVLLVWQIELL